MSALYTVTIKRQRPPTKTDGFLFGFYWWEVEVQPDSSSTHQQYELRGTGTCRSVKNAKKKALKHILSVQRELDDGVSFGIQFKEHGDVDEMKELLS